MNTAHCRTTFGLFLLTSCLCLLSPRAQGQTELANLYVDDPRPVAAAVLSLIGRYPVVITYEDPHYEYAGDIQDVTELVRSIHPNARRTLGPRGGPLQTSYEVARDTREIVSIADTLDHLLEAKNVNPVGGRFAVRQVGDVFHVVPVQIRDVNGVWVQQTSILDTPIAFSSEELSGYELIEAILKEVNDASGANILGLAAESFTNTLSRYRGKVEAKNEPARDVLLRTLHSISERFTWLLNYDPTGEYYVFALAVAAEPPKEVPPDPSQLPQPGAPMPVSPPPTRD